MFDLSYENRFGGLTRLYGDEALEKLRESRVAVVGLGGVGSWAAEALVRSGVGRLVLIDLDDVCVTNTNRQLHAADGAYGKSKATVMAARLKTINPFCEVETVVDFLTPSNAKLLLDDELDFVIDAIDSVPDKAVMVEVCRDRGIPLAVSGGAGGRTDPTKVRVDDLGREQGDSLLKAVKRALKKNGRALADDQGFYGVKCVFSTEPPILPWEVCPAVQKGPGGIGCEAGWGAAVFGTGTFGFVLASIAVSTLAHR